MKRIVQPIYKGIIQLRDINYFNGKIEKAQFLKISLTFVLTRNQLLNVNAHLWKAQFTARIILQKKLSHSVNILHYLLYNKLELEPVFYFRAAQNCRLQS